jgi:hypothetical protein
MSKTNMGNFGIIVLKEKKADITILFSHYNRLNFCVYPQITSVETPYSDMMVFGGCAFGS